MKTADMAKLVLIGILGTLIKHHSTVCVRWVVLNLKTRCHCTSLDMIYEILICNALVQL